MYASAWYGQLESGTIKTTPNNNRMRTHGALKAGAKKQISAGDDLMCWPPIDGPSLKITGAILKAGIETTANWKRGEPVIFTGHTFKKEGDKWTARFVNLAKALNGLLLTISADEKKAGFQSLRGICHVCRHSPDQIKKLRRVGLSAVEAKAWRFHTSGSNLTPAGRRSGALSSIVPWTSSRRNPQRRTTGQSRRACL